MSNDIQRRVVGYARVSTKDQDLTSQIERVRKHITENDLVPAVEGALFHEKLSGAYNHRPERARIHHSFCMRNQKISKWTGWDLLIVLIEYCLPRQSNGTSQA